MILYTRDEVAKFVSYHRKFIFIGGFIMSKQPEDTYWNEEMEAYIGYETNELYYDAEGTEPMHGDDDD